MARRDLGESRIVITGASSGIGEALARRLAVYRPQLLLTARRRERLERLAQELRDQGATVTLVVGNLVDVTTRNAAQQAISSWNGLDVLINNAGVGAVGPFAMAHAERLRQVMDVNFLAPVELTRLLLPNLRLGRRPLIVNVASVLGHVAVPKKSEYCASKFALRAWSNAIRCELAAEGIDVLVVSPNTTRSEFFESLLDQQGSVRRNPWSMTTDAVARRIVAAMRSGRRELILTASGRALRWFDWHFLRTLSYWLSRLG